MLEYRVEYRDDDTRIRMAFLKAYPVESVGLRLDLSREGQRYIHVGMTKENILKHSHEIPWVYEGMAVRLYETTRAIAC